MKTARSFISVFMAAFLVTFSVLLVYAGDMVSQDGINVTVTTDSESYNASDSIVITVAVENDSIDPLEGVCIDVTLPEELETEDSVQILDVDIDPEDSYEATLVATLGDEYRGTSSANGGDGPAKEDADNTSAPDKADSGKDDSVYGKYGLYILIGVGAVVAAAIVTLIFLIVKRARAARLLSLLLCTALILPIISSATAVFAADTEDFSISAETTVSVDGAEYVIGATVNYSVELGRECTVTFDPCDGTETQSVTVEAGSCLPAPLSFQREDHILLGWYSDRELTTSFDGETPVYRSITLYASWLDISDPTDTDGEGLTDVLEDYFGSDKEITDTDGDGLSDYIEAIVLSYDAAAEDTDGDGTADHDEDPDDDGITNIIEIESETNPISGDTDGDGLSDSEGDEHGTDPLNADTDGDGASDGIEVELGTDPLTADESFDATATAENEGDTVSPSVSLTLDGSQLESLKVEAYDNKLFFPEDMPGYMGMAYDFGVDGEFDSATISFEFDAGLAGDGCDPVIYYFNEEDQSLEELETVVRGNVASTTVTHFSKYILIDKAIYSESFMWVDVWEDSDYSGVEIVFVIDDSGSMYTNDYYDERLTVVRSMVDDLPDSAKMGLVKFATYSHKMTSQLTTDKEYIKNYLSSYYFSSSGGTYMYEAVFDALELYESDEDDILKVMIVLSDGETEDIDDHSGAISAANREGVKIYTVGLGSDSEYFYQYLQPLAHSTGGAFYYADDADQLAAIYEDISEKIDITTDSDDDGISDYYDEHLVTFTGVRLDLDKNNSDSDGDGLKDGKEVVMVQSPNEDGSMVMVTGKYIYGDPSTVDADRDGILDPDDSRPFLWDVCDRDLAMLSKIIYNDDIKNNMGVDLSRLSPSLTSSIDEGFYGTASVEELFGWRLVYRFEISYPLGYGGGLCFGLFRKDDNLVVAVRGSDGSIIYSADWYNNINTYTWTTDVDTETLMAKICPVVNSYLGPNDKLYITGHSRGGMLAQRAAVRFVETGQQNKITRLVYFNGIGVVFAKGLWGTGRGWYDDLESISRKVTRYNVDGDVVDQIGYHVTSRTTCRLSPAAKNNVFLLPTHDLSSFTYYLMPERFERLPEMKEEMGR